MTRAFLLRYVEALVGCAIAAAGAFFAILSARLPASPDPTAPGPAMAPGSLGLILIVFGGLIAVISAKKAALAPPMDNGPALPLRQRKVEIALIMIGGCVLLLEPLGFMLSTILFLVAGFVFLGEISWRFALPAATLAAVSLWLFFTKLLGVGLPYGLIAEVLFR